MQTLESPTSCRATPVRALARTGRGRRPGARYRKPVVAVSHQAATGALSDAPARTDVAADGRDFVAANFALIEGAVGFVCRQKRLSRDEAEDLASLVYLRLLESGGSMLRQFRGESSLRTFLIVVVQRMLIDARIARWGKWRPSVRARRLGAVAVNLERLIFRDGMRLGEAAQALRLQFEIADTDDELHVLLSLLPQRSRRRFVGSEALQRLPAANPGPDHGLSRAPSRLALEALERVVGSLGPEDQQLIRLRFDEGLRMCQIARLQRIDEKAIYRRFEGLLRNLRRHLQDQGISAGDVRAWLESVSDG
jgi:RNA polymerase sigma factor (sigma-70 family)